MVPLKYATWKVQCKMALIKGLWSIVDETETAPVDEGALAKFVGRKNKALATIVLQWTRVCYMWLVLIQRIPVSCGRFWLTSFTNWN